MADRRGSAWVVTRAAVLLAGGLVLATGCKKASPPIETPAATPAPVAPKRVPVTTPPAIKKHLYPEVASGPADVKEAIAEAHRTHKRVLIDFGGDWCGDCQVLDIYFHEAPNEELLDKNFVKVNVNIGHQDANIDLALKYGVPLHGVPALSVLDGNGKVLFGQHNEFSDMRYMDPSSVTEFLTKWKP